MEAALGRRELLSLSLLLPPLAAALLGPAAPLGQVPPGPARSLPCHRHFPCPCHCPCSCPSPCPWPCPAPYKGEPALPRGDGHSALPLLVRLDRIRCAVSDRSEGGGLCNVDVFMLSGLSAYISMVRCRTNTHCIGSTLVPSLLVNWTKKRVSTYWYIHKYTGHCVDCFSVPKSMLYLGGISFKFGGFLKEQKECIGYDLGELSSGNKKICHRTRWALTSRITEELGSSVWAWIIIR